MVSSTGVLGGAERIFLDLFAHAEAGGFAPSALLFGDGPLADRLRSSGAEVSVEPIGSLRDPRNAARAMRTVATVIAQSRPDCIFGNGPWAHLAAAVPARWFGIPAFWHQARVPCPAPRAERVISMLPACCVIALSRDAVRAQQRLRPGPPVALFQPGVDLARVGAGDGGAVRARYGIPASAPLFGIVGRLQRWKGQDKFLRAAREVLTRIPEAHFAVVGGAILGSEGSYPRELEDLAAELGLDERLTFTGDTDDAPSWFSALDVMVNASAPEPFGLVMIEAMACGAVVVAIDGGGPADVIDDGVTGFLCESAEPRLLAAMMIEASADGGRRDRIARAARDVVEANFTVERMARDFGAVVRRCVD